MYGSGTTRTDVTGTSIGGGVTQVDGCECCSRTNDPAGRGTPCTESIGGSTPGAGTALVDGCEPWPRTTVPAGCSPKTRTTVPVELNTAYWRMA